LNLLHAIIFLDYLTKKVLNGIVSSLNYDLPNKLF
jgi:hypothetical protein